MLAGTISRCLFGLDMLKPECGIDAPFFCLKRFCRWRRGRCGMMLRENVKVEARWKEIEDGIERCDGYCIVVLEFV
jgi:hypothetical protein